MMLTDVGAALVPIPVEGVGRGPHGVVGFWPLAWSSLKIDPLLRGCMLLRSEDLTRAKASQRMRTTPFDFYWYRQEVGAEVGITLWVCSTITTTSRLKGCTICPTHPFHNFGIER